jgi:hypothetical protein
MNDVFDLWKKEADTINSDVKLKKTKPKKPSLKPLLVARKYVTKFVDEELPKNIANFIPSGGSSYHPEKIDHHKSIATAVAHVVKEEYEEKKYENSIPKKRKNKKKDNEQLSSLRSLLRTPLVSESKINEEEENGGIEEKEEENIPEKPISKFKKVRLRAKRVKVIMKLARQRKIENEERIKKAKAEGKV